MYDGAAEHNRAIPVERSRPLDRECLGVDSTLDEPGGNRLGDLMACHGAGGCGDENFHGSAPWMSADWASLLGAPIAPLSLVFRRKGSLQRLGGVERRRAQRRVAPAGIAVREQQRERERVLLLVVGARCPGTGTRSASRWRSAATAGLWRDTARVAAGDLRRRPPQRLAGAAEASRDGRRADAASIATVASGASVAARRAGRGARRRSAAVRAARAGRRRSDQGAGVNCDRLRHGVRLLGCEASLLERERGDVARGVDVLDAADAAELSTGMKPCWSMRQAGQLGPSSTAA